MKVKVKIQKMWKWSVKWASDVFEIFEDKSESERVLKWKLKLGFEKVEEWESLGEQVKQSVNMRKWKSLGEKVDFGKWKWKSWRVWVRRSLYFSRHHFLLQLLHQPPASKGILQKDKNRFKLGKIIEFNAVEIYF